MNLLNVNPFFQIVLKGAVLIMAVSFYSKKKSGRRMKGVILP